VQSVVALPGATARGTLDLVVVLAFAVTTVLLAGGGEATELTVLHDRGDDPVDAGVVADGLVLDVDHDDLVVLVGGVLADPVRVEDTERAALASGAFLGLGAKGALELELLDTLSHGLTVADTLGDRALAATTLDAHAVDGVTLLGLVAKAAGLVWAGWARSTVDRRQLAEVPGANPEKETQDVALLALVKLFEILVGTHGELII